MQIEVIIVMFFLIVDAVVSGFHFIKRWTGTNEMNLSVGVSVFNCPSASLPMLGRRMLLLLMMMKRLS